MYDKSLINNLFSFDLDQKLVVLKKEKSKSVIVNANNPKIDISKLDTLKLKENFKNIDSNNQIDIFSKEKFDNQLTLEKNNISPTKKKIKKKVKKKIIVKTNGNQLKVYNEIEKSPNNENKLSIEENKDPVIENTKANRPILNNLTQNNRNNTIIKDDNNLKSLYINNWTILCFWCSSRKKNVNKILFEEGSKIITQRLDIMNMFNYLYINEIIQEKLGIEARYMEMSDNFKNSLHYLKQKSLDI